MGLEETDSVSRMISEGGPVQYVEDPCSKNSSFPERRGRIRIPSVLKIAETIDPASGQPIIDRVVLFSVTSMDWGS